MDGFAIRAGFQAGTTVEAVEAIAVISDNDPRGRRGPSGHGFHRPAGAWVRA